MQQLPEEATATATVVLLRVGVVNGNGAMKAEGYELKITENRLTVEAENDAGLFYGVQTLVQLASVNEDSGPGSKTNIVEAAGDFEEPVEGMVEVTIFEQKEIIEEEQLHKENQKTDSRAAGVKRERRLSFKFPLVEIVDFPRYSWRGMMLDSSRHFQSKKFVKRYIELLALHKLCMGRLQENGPSASADGPFSV